MSAHWHESITLHQLRLFAAVAQERSFVKAANTLFISEATVSEQVRSLETLVGARLLDRSPGRRNVELTEAGSIILRGYERALAELELAARELESRLELERGTVHLGVGPHFGSTVLPSLCAAFRARYPQIVVRPEIDQPQRLLDNLRRHRLDLVVQILESEDKDLSSEPLAEYHLILVGPPGHRLAGMEALAPFTALAAEPLVLPEPGYAVRQHLERLAATAGIALNVVLEVDSPEVQMQAAASGIGSTVVTSQSAPLLVDSGRLAPLRVEGFPFCLQWRLVMAKDRLTPPAEKFREFLHRYMATLEGRL